MILCLYKVPLVILRNLCGMLFVIMLYFSALYCILYCISCVYNTTAATITNATPMSNAILCWKAATVHINHRHLLSTHADRQGANISVTVCLFFCAFVRLRISPPRIKLVASYFARRFIGVQEISHFGELCSPRSPKSKESASAPPPPQS